MKNWESHCHRCGLCCYEKVRQSDGTWILDRSKPCPWLNKSTMVCKIYEKRLKVYPRCRKVHLWHALFAPYLPPTCGYVLKFRPRWFPHSKMIISESIDTTDDPGEESGTA